MSVLIPNPQANGSSHDLTRKLTPRHLADLRRSGLNDETIERYGFHSLSAPASVQKILRWKRYNGELGDCLAIPFPGRDGKLNGYTRLKPDRPRKSNADGKAIKYESPKGSANRAYSPPDTSAALTDPAIALLLTEGEKKAAKANQEGFPCVGLVGVFGWHKRRKKDADGKPVGERELIDDLAASAWQGRAVYIVFDSDAATNKNVVSAEYALAQTLQRHGANVKVIRLPPGEPGPDGTPTKIGLDDFLVTSGPDALRQLLAEALEPTPPERGLTPNEAADDPHRLARLYISERCTHDKGLTLRFWRDEWHRWAGSAYRVLPNKELIAELTASAKAELDRVNVIAQKLAEDNKPPPVARKITGRLITDVAHALSSLCVLPGRMEPPAWIGPERPFLARELLAAQNALIHLPSLVARKSAYCCPHSPRFFSTNALDYPFDLSAPEPTAWLAFLRQLWPNDLESVLLLQEWMGYLLTADTRQQKILILVGPRRSGKGTIGRVIHGLVGASNFVAPTLASLATNFGLWPLLDKTVAVISDARLSGRTDTAVVVERLLSISGEDPQTVDRKNLPHVTTKLAVRFTLLSNELPRLSDSSGALTGRMLLLRLQDSFYGKEDHLLTDKLLVELPGILLWSIAGWERLRERGYFVQPPTGRELLGDLEDLTSPIGAFVRDRCVIGPEYRVSVEEIFDAWRTWCAEKGRKEPGTEQMFGRDLLAALPTLRRVRPRDSDSRYRAYEGISLVPR